MVGCAAPFCNNSSVKGYTMKIFPRDVKRRAQWAANMNRVNWTPTNNSYLCEVHFAPEMWERRMDNKRKLKPYAVPTIFGFFIKEKVKFPEATEKGNLPESDLVYDVQNQDESEKMTKIVIVTSNASTIGTCDNEVYEETDLKATGKNKSLSKNHDLQHLDDNEKMATNLVVTSNTSIINTCDNKVRKDPKATERDKNLFERDTVHDLQDLDGNKEMATNVIIKPSISIINANKNKVYRERETKGEKYCKINQGKQHNLIYLRKQNKALRNQIQKLKNIIINNKYRLALKKILTDDQIKALFTKTRRIRNWSNKTIQRALQLKFTCGSSGYNELRREGIPLPGLRTLRRKIENLKFGSEISSNNRN
ncbi:PREDICTED: THAP domain-containing protein 5-like [Vollenhovia emeryi]|uniref:THAP domain-containing protein 5-like n=1 Tax=Vollenhovia emeryi TaxID=411798 RepID=UPI0005F496BE|nr:PREDICTED: THAP domain-containing protein 5-like [Vollenhovia emeryi]